MILKSIRYLLLGLAPVVLMGQDPKIDLKADEAAIRDAIKRDAVQYTEDRIHWSGAFKRPTEGSERGDAFPTANIGKRKNEKDSVKVERLEIAASGDIAWEFSYGRMEYDVDDSSSRHVVVEQGILRVWKKVDGDWRGVAVFYRPLDTPFVAH